MNQQREQAVSVPDGRTPVQAVPLSQGTVVEQSRAIAEVAAAVQVAQQFPRDERAAERAMVDLCSRLPIAEQAFYQVPNRGSGMSIHIARELARIWGNVDYGVRELRRDDEQGVSEMTVWAWDQQKNARATRSFIQPHARMKDGRRQALTDLSDIYLSNQNIGARAVRECIFQILPGWYVKEAESILSATLKNGGGKPIEERIAEAIERFDDIDIPLVKLERLRDRPSSEWEPKDVAALARVYTAITQDGIAPASFFPEEAVTVPGKKPQGVPPATDTRAEVSAPAVPDGSAGGEPLPAAGWVDGPEDGELV